MPVGLGYDVHKLVKGRKLVLGGINIPFSKGLLGHSDADVLVHAICDALLGAAGMGDIGLHFPDDQIEFKDIYSIELLFRVYKLLASKKKTIVNIDATIFAQAPKLSPYRESMEKCIAKSIDIDPSCINIKATTTEGLGIIGEGNGMAAMCVALID